MGADGQPEIHVHVHVDGTDLRRVESLLHRILRNQEHEMIDITSIQAQVEAETALDQSAVVLIGGLADQISQLAAEVAGDAATQQKLNDLADQLRTAQTALSNAVLANTPAAPDATQPDPGTVDPGTTADPAAPSA